MSKITKRVVDAIVADPGGKDIFTWDTELRGFGVRTKGTGISTYLIQYRTAQGQTRRLRIARVGTVTPDEAREQAKIKLAEANAGRDPSLERHEARNEITVSELCEQYLEAARAGRVITRFGRPKSPSTIAIDEGRVARHIKPLIGKKVAAQIKRADIQRMADDIAAGKTAGKFTGKLRGKAVVTGGIGTAARVVELLGGIFTWADRRAIVSGVNPVRGVEKVRGQTKTRILSDDELDRLGAVLALHEVIAQDACNAIRLIALTGLRREEAVGLRLSEIDFGNSCLRLEKTKTGPSVRPIGVPAVELLERISATSRCWLFRNASDTGSADLKSAIARLFDAAGLLDARSQVLRRTFASVAAAEEYGDGTIAELLGHSKQGVTARHYIRRPDEALIAAATKVATRIDMTMRRQVADVRSLEDARAEKRAGLAR